MASLREIKKSRTISPHSLTYLLTDPTILRLPVTTYVGFGTEKGDSSLRKDREMDDKALMN